MRTAPDMWRAFFRGDNATLSEDPKLVGSTLVAGFAQFTASIPTDLWERIVEEAAAPCGEPGCACETLRIELLSALSACREDYRAQILTRGQS